MKKVYWGSLLATVAILLLVLAGPVNAQPGFEVEDTNGPIGNVAQVRWNFQDADPASICGIDVCIFVPESNVTNIDLSECFDEVGAPHAGSAFSQCAIRTDGSCFSDPDIPAVPPDTSVIRIALIDFGSVIQNPGIAEDAAGFLNLTLSNALNENDTIEIEAFQVAGAFATCTGTPVVPDYVNGGIVTAVELVSILDVQPVSINFGDQFTGSVSSPQAVTISNEGTDGVDVEVTNITLTGDFALDGPSCVGAVISDGNTCVQNVVFSPASDGPHAGTLTVFSDAGQVLNDAVNLSGNAISPPTDLIFTVSPNYGVEGGPLFWGVEIQVLDANGALYVADSSSIVELSLETDPTGLATLSGMTQTTVVNGVATFAFTDLSIDLVGTGFRLEVSDQGGSLNSDLSDFFNVVEDQLLRDRFEQ